MALLWLFIALGYLLLYAFAAAVPQPAAILPDVNPYLVKDAPPMYSGAHEIDMMALEWEG